MYDQTCFLVKHIEIFCFIMSTMMGAFLLRGGLRLQLLSNSNAVSISTAQCNSSVCGCRAVHAALHP